MSFRTLWRLENQVEVKNQQLRPPEGRMAEDFSVSSLFLRQQRAGKCNFKWILKVFS